MKLIKEIIMIPEHATKKNPFTSAVVKFKDGTQQEFTDKPLYRTWVEKNYSAVDQYLRWANNPRRS